MKHSFPTWLLPLAIIIGIPSIACFGYYSLAYLDQPNGFVSSLVVLAYPLGILSFALCLASFIWPVQLRSLRWVAGLLGACCAALLLILRL